MSEVTPSPSLSAPALFGRVSLVGVAVVLLSWSSFIGLSLLALPLPERGWVGLARLAGVMALVQSIGLAVALGMALREAPGLSRSLRRLDDGEPDAPPPSAVAVRDAYAMPVRVMVPVAALMGVLLSLEGLGLLGVSGFGGGLRVGSALIAAGVMQAGLAVGAGSWRRVLSSWLDRIEPSDVPLGERPNLSQRLYGQTASAVALLVLGEAGLLVAHLAPSLTGAANAEERALVALIIAIVGVVVIGAVAAEGCRRIVRSLLADCRELMRHVRHLIETSSWETGQLSSDAVAGLRTRDGARLAAHVDELAARYAALAHEEHRSREAIEAAQRLKSRFMAYMSHDLRSPLNSITGFAEVLAGGTDGPLNDDQMESVETIKESGQDLLRLVTEIVDSARLEAGRLAVHPSWTAPAVVLTEAIGSVRPIADRRSIELTSELQPGLPPVFVDAERVQQALVGVLVHAVRIVKGGTVRLVVHLAEGPPGPAGQVRVDIDALPGIPEEDSERIFEAFREIREPSGRRVGGLGLGVALARGLMVEQGGDLWYETAGPHGARFCLALPTDGPAPEA